MPFLGWNCITLYLKDREVDLIIKDEKDMEYFIKFLIVKLRSADGIRDTSTKLLNELNQQSLRLMNITLPSASQLDRISKENEHFLLKKVYMKYHMMRVRQKISYIAFLNKKTITELILSQIIKSY